MPRKLTTAEVTKRIEKLVGSEYTMLSEYVNRRTKIQLIHNKCGHIYMTNWDRFQAGARCAKCAGNYRYTDREITELIHSMSKGEYEKRSTYKNKETKLTLHHNKCGHTYKASWNSFRNGCRCPKCAGNIKQTEADFDQFITKKTGNEYTRVGEYVNTSTKTRIKHNVCGYIYEVAPSTFKAGHRCSKCAKSYHYSDTEMAEMIASMTDKEYRKIGEYKNAHTKMLVEHIACGHIYSVKWSDFQVGKRCPRCRESRGEKAVAEYLTSSKIPFRPQVSFDNCRYKNKLAFDFGVLDKKGGIVALIEYDGIQHFEAVKGWGGEKQLQIIQQRDAVKNSYCVKNKLPLLRIRYSEDVKERLDTFFKTLKLYYREVSKL